MGWTCDAKPNAVLDTLKSTCTWKNTVWWRNTKALNMMLAPITTHDGSTNGVAQLSMCVCVLHKIASEWTAGERSGK